jgi:hypothetical protein
LDHEHESVGGGAVCATCGARMEKEDELCNSCRTPVREIIMSNLPGDLPAEECVHWSDGPASAGRAAKLSVAGILILMSGVLGVAQAFLGLTEGIGEDFLRIYEDLVPMAGTTGELVAKYVLLQVGAFIFGAFAILGSLFTFNRSNFGLSVAGGVAGVLAIGLLIGAFFSLVGLMLIATSKKQFMSECG